MRTNSAPFCRKVKIRVPGLTPVALKPATSRAIPALKSLNVHLKYFASCSLPQSGILWISNKSCGWPTLASARLSGYSCTVCSKRSQAERTCAGRGGPWTSLCSSSECGMLYRLSLAIGVERIRAVEDVTSYQHAQLCPSTRYLGRFTESSCGVEVSRIRFLR